jgi:hypothetical protein
MNKKLIFPEQAMIALLQYSFFKDNRFLAMCVYVIRYSFFFPRQCVLLNLDARPMGVDPQKDWHPTT